MKTKNPEGKTAIVTGAAGAIGGEIASLLDRSGMSLALADINVDGMNRLAARLSREPLIVECDITRKEDAAALAAAAEKRFGAIHALVNNAGIIFPSLFEDAQYPDIEKQIAVNLMGTIYLTKESVPALKRAGGGAIVTISSLAGIVPETYSSIYTATKFALRGLNLSLGLELAKHNISVSTVFPDSVDTPMLAYEAAHGGSPLTFLNPPQPPAAVARAVLRALREGRPEYCVPASQGFACRLAMCFPGIIHAVWPRLEKTGEKKKLEFIRSHGIGDNK